MVAFSKVVPFCAAITLAAAIGLAQQATKPAPKSDNSTGAATAGASAKARAKPRGRLPVHYGKVVDPTQKEKIYKIQQSYEPKIAELNAQLQALRDNRDAEIDAVLTAEQRQKVAQYRADAKKQRAKAGAADNAEAAADVDAADVDAADDGAADEDAADDTDAAGDAPPVKAAPAKSK